MFMIMCCEHKLELINRTTEAMILYIHGDFVLFPELGMLWSMYESTDRVDAACCKRWTDCTILVLPAQIG